MIRRPGWLGLGGVWVLRWLVPWVAWFGLAWAWVGWWLGRWLGSVLVAGFVLLSCRLAWILDFD